MTAEPFLTDGVSVESHFLNAKHLAELNAISEEEMQTLLDVATAANEETSIEKYVNGRSDVERKAGTFGKLNLGQLAAAAPKIVNGDPKRYRDS
jgi:hypothetical protein